ncbi:MAG: hypothetical protein ABJB55_05020 [Actinomycetota bacterium]
MTPRSTIRACTAVALVAALGGVPVGRASAATAATPDATWVTNGTVWSVLPLGSTTYLAGDFTEVSPPTGNVLALDATSGALDTAFPTVSGVVRAVAARPGGGWFVAGSFTTIGGKSRAGLAVTTAGDLVGGWNPKPTGGNVTDLALSPDGSVLYLAGTFTAIGATPRDGFAAFTTADLKLTAWAPGGVSAGIVNALAVAPAGTIYVGGSFTGIAGAGRSRIAALSPAGAVTSWNPGANDTVWALAATTTSVYAGGAFTTLAHVAQSRLGAIDATTGGALAWIGTGADAPVRSLALSGATLYVGGDFANLDGAARAHLGAVGIADGTATGFAPGADDVVTLLSVSGDGTHLVAGGPFGSTGGVEARKLATIDTATGLADTAWTPNPNDLPRAIGRSADGSVVLAGGLFTGAGGVVRDHLAALNATTGAATGWNPPADGTVYALAASPAGDVVYAGGSFSHVGGLAEQKLAAIDATSGDVVSGFHVSANNRVRSLATQGDLLYVGGEFTKLGGQPRMSVGAVHISTGVLDASWLPSADGMVRTIEPAGDRIYLGGDFLHVGGSDRDHLAAVDPATGADVTAFATATPKYRTFQLSTDGTLIFAAMGGPGGRLRAYRADGSIAWEVTADGDVQACTWANGLVYIGGHFTSLAHIGRSQIGAADAATGALDAWAPNLNGSIWTMAADGAAVHLGGTFTRAAGVVRAGYARFAVS